MSHRKPQPARRTAANAPTVAVTPELATLTSLALLGNFGLRVVMAEALPECQELSSWADGWIVEPRSNARLGLLPRRFRPLPVAENRVRVTAIGADVEVSFAPHRPRSIALSEAPADAVLFIRPELGARLDTLSAFETLLAGVWPDGFAPRPGPGPLWDAHWFGPADFAPMLLHAFQGRFARLPYAPTEARVATGQTIRVTVGLEFAATLAAQLSDALFVNGTLLGNRLLERIEPDASRSDADLALDDGGPVVVECVDPKTGWAFVDERYAPPGTDPLRTFRIKPDGRLVFHADAGVVPCGLRIVYLHHLPWPGGFDVAPETLFELDRTPVLRAVSELWPDRSASTPVAQLRDGALWLLTRPPVRYPSRQELREAVFAALPSPLRAWVEDTPELAVRVEARRDERSERAIPTWVVPLRPRPGAVNAKVDRFFPAVARRLRQQFGDLPIRLEWEGHFDG